MQFSYLSVLILALLAPKAVLANPKIAQRALDRRETAAINITNVETVNQNYRSGELSYGATNLAFGYSAGAGINFDSKTVGGGFNAGIPNKAADGAVGGGWTIMEKNLTIGLGASWANQSVNVSIVGDAAGGLTVLVNGKAVEF